MKEITIRKVFRAVVRGQGYDPDSAGLSATQKEVIAETVNDKVKWLWEDDWWSELMTVEEREYRATWDATLNYSTGDEVYYDSNYYVSLLDNNVNQQPDTATTYWETVGDNFVRTISFTQDGETEIGNVDTKNCIFDRNPQVYPDSQPLPNVYLYQDNIIVRTQTAPYQPYVRFRPPPREYSWTAWAAATAYAVADLVYLEDYGSVKVGQTFKAIQANTNRNPYQYTTDWQPVDFPAFMFTYVKHAAISELLREDEGRYKEQRLANAELDRLKDTLVDSTGMRQRAVFNSGR
ncbi:MAG: hypothetical protein ACYTEQ_03590 [Planctomycetota bacterium]|jgi:hypothetical protein